MNSELNLLAEALSTNGEAENNGVKYIYMDDSTVYRFENNRMKKVSAAMIKKANKLLETQGSLPNTTPSPTAKKSTKRTKQQQQAPPPPPPEEQAEEEDDDEEQPAPPPPPKPAKRAKATKRQTAVADTGAANIDLNEYYNNKNRMEFMTMEIDRLNNKISKLRQYKSIVNKITGGEYEAPDYQPQLQPQQQQPQQFQQQPRQICDTLFQF